MEPDDLKNQNTLFTGQIKYLQEQVDDLAINLNEISSVTVSKIEPFDYELLDLEEKVNILENKVDRLERTFQKLIPFLPDSAKLFLELDESEDRELWKTQLHHTKK